MNTDRLWHISTDDFARAVEAIKAPTPFDLDNTVHTWHVSYFRFVRAPVAAFPSIIEFAAMAIYTTDSPNRPILDWARSVAIFPIFPEQFMDTINAARDDCVAPESDCDSIPDWLQFDGDVIDAFELTDRGGPLRDIASHDVYRTNDSYYYVCINRES